MAEFGRKGVKPFPRDVLVKKFKFPELSTSELGASDGWELSVQFKAVNPLTPEQLRDAITELTHVAATHGLKVKLPPR